VWWVTFCTDWHLDKAALLILQSALESFDRAQAAAAEVARDGLTVEDRYGKKRMHPCCLIERDARATMLQSLKALALDLEPLHDKPGRPSGS